jgi:hypothetical protein
MAICLRRALATRGLLSLHGARHLSGISSLTSLISNSFVDEASRFNPRSDSGLSGFRSGFDFSDRRCFAKGRKQSKSLLYISWFIRCFISLNIDHSFLWMVFQRNRMKGIQFKLLLPLDHLSNHLPRHKWRRLLLL